MRTMHPVLLVLFAVAVFALTPVAVAGTPDADIEALIVKARDPSTSPEAIKQLTELGPDAVPVLTQGLWADAAATRRVCALVLAEIGADARAAAPSLVRMLGDDSKDVRLAAVRALGAVQAHAAIPALTKALKDEAPAVRLGAARSLITLGADAATVLPVLTRSLVSEDADERSYAVGLLGELGPEAAPAVPQLQDALADANPSLTIRTADALGRIGADAKTAAPALKKKLDDDKNADLYRVSVAIALWRVARDESAAPLLRGALASNKEPRAVPHVPLWRIDRSVDTLDALLKRIATEDQFDPTAAYLLGARAKEVVPMLTKSLKSFLEKMGERDTVTAASRIPILGRIGPPAKEALEPLKAIAKEKNVLQLPAAIAVYRIDSQPDNALAIAAFLDDQNLRRAAAEALKELRPTGKAVAIELLVALENPDEEFRLPVAVALWRIEKSAEALKVLTKLLSSTDPKMRERAAAELGFECGPDARAAVPDLVKRLFDSRSAVRSVAAEALGRIGPGARDAAPALLALLESDELAFVQSAACEALGRIEPAEKEAVVAALKKKLEHPAALVRAHAALALVLAAGDKTGKDEAERGLGDRSHHVRITAAEALWQINKDGRALALLIRALEEANLNGLESENERYMAARALGRIGADAKPAVTEVLKLLDARDDDLVTAARSALKLIDPDAAKKAGIK
jgi:HEAT repeat protein